MTDTMTTSGWLRKRHRESSHNLLPLQQRHNRHCFLNSTASTVSAKCHELALNGRPPLPASHHQKHPHELLPVRIAKSFSWSSFNAPSQPTTKNNTESCGLMSLSAHSVGSTCPSVAANMKSSPAKSYHSNNGIQRKRRSPHRIYLTKLLPFLQWALHFFGQLYTAIIHTKLTPKQSAIAVASLLTLYAQYQITHRLEWEQDLEWTTWEIHVQNSIRESIPPLLTNNSLHTQRFSHLDNVKQFPHLLPSNASEYIVPIPDYDTLARVRGELSSSLKKDAINTCQLLQQQNQKQQQQTQQPTQMQQLPTRHVLPVMGITVANDTPQNRYLRRILHTIDFHAVGSIVLTWYDENTEAQLLGGQAGLSHEVIEEALQEFVNRFGFVEIDWKEDRNVETENAASDENGMLTENEGDGPPQANLRLASFKSLQLLSQTTTSLHQYCRYDNRTNSQQQPFSGCENELVIIRFPTNLGCSPGVNNPLFTHPTAPYWLIANYDIAYPPGVLAQMGKAVQTTMQSMPDLAVHTFGYIYGRGRLENPWSNFVMTSCAVARVGVWDEDIFPAYYEDDDFRDRVRYIMGRWVDDIGLRETGYEDAPTKWMEDRHLIRYQTDRSVAVAHGPLSADTYVSGTHDTMQKVEDEEIRANSEKHSFLHMFLGRKSTSSLLAQNPFHYDSLRWKTVRELADTETYFRCKHGNLPDPGEFGEDTLRYFGWNERFLLPFVNETRVDRIRREMEINGTLHIDPNLSLWSSWSFNATRRKCVHEGANRLLSLPYTEDVHILEERKNLTMELRSLCSVC
ncbi:hypothetical protein ACHAWX_007592 [Stephanocyclus meneghinianus]